MVSNTLILKAYKIAIISITYVFIVSIHLSFEYLLSRYGRVTSLFVTIVAIEVTCKIAEYLSYHNIYLLILRRFVKISSKRSNR